MYRMHLPELQRMHDELADGIRIHADWHRHLIRTLVCHLRPDPEDLDADAHRACGFGVWLHDHAQRGLHVRREYAAIDVEHTRLHRLAAALLREMAERGVVSRESFDQFLECSGRLRHELDALRHEMSVALRSRDVLTGALRRAELLPALREAWELVSRGVQSACVAFMDLDRFKVVNDTYGHGLGDEVLVRATHCVTEHLRPYDKVFRYGGDEFLLLLPGTRPEEAWQLVERIRAELARTRLGTTPEGEAIGLSASFGITSIETDLTVEECIARADKALLLAKAAGRNRVVCWDPAVTTGTMIDRELSGRPASPGSAVR